MFESLVAATTGTSGAGAASAWARVENAACARRVAAMAAMLDAAYAADGSASRDQWCLDNFDAVAAHVGAALCITPGAAAHRLLIAVSLHERFPKVAAVFADGLITYEVVRTVVQRGALVIDPDALRTLDAALAEALSAGEPMSVNALERTVDAVVASVDPHAVHRTQTKARDRSVEVTVEDGSGLANMYASLFLTDAKAFNARLDSYAATVCPNDPRTKAQRRADAFGAVGREWDRLPCLCGLDDCPAAQNPPAAGVVVYVIASAETLEERPAPEQMPDGVPDVPGGVDGPDGVDDCQDTEDVDCDAACVDEATDHSAIPNEAAAQQESAGDSDCAEDPTVPHEASTERESINIPANPGSSHVPASADRSNQPASQSESPENIGSGALDDRTALDGKPPKLFTKPLRELTLTEALTPAPGRGANLRPAALMGGQFLPGAIACRATIGATITRIVHPGQAPPEPRYRPSKKLADFIRCRDLTCRFPGCRVPATHCDVDHSIPWPCGPTAASNLKCLCRRHHLLKTFWGGQNGWRDQQFDDGTIVWTAPDDRTHVTIPGSRLLFPELSEPTAPVTASSVPARHASGLTMPRRTTTRAQDRANRIHRERELNALGVDHTGTRSGDGQFLVGGDDEDRRGRGLEGDPPG